ncbi:MAG: GGDEF domain-containing protein [Lachnospiraceae bacterium]|nr:GGDEF domain-containing protein [Lachnospiraceae bacterium]
MDINVLSLELNLFCIAILLYILYRCFRRHDRQISQIKFKNMVLFHVFAMLINAFGPYIIRSASEEQIDSVGFFSLCLYYALLIIAVASWEVYLVSEVRELYRKPVMRLINYSVAVQIVLNVTTRWTHLLYYYDDGQLIRQPFSSWQESYLFVIQFLLAAMAIYHGMHRNRKSERKKILLITTYPLIPFIFMIFRIFGYKLPYLAISNTMAILIIYIGYLDQLISVDPLTQINNRDLLFDRIDDMMREYPTELYLFMMDVDGLKKVNDRYGHVAGDRALILIADSLKHICGKYGKNTFLARYGGDEFIMISNLPLESVDQVCQGIEDELKKQTARNHLSYKLSVSIGIAQYTKDMVTAEKFISAADEKLYQIKREKHREDRLVEFL